VFEQVIRKREQMQNKVHDELVFEGSSKWQGFGEGKNTFRKKTI
jgi:hypothetical protein